MPQEKLKKLCCWKCDLVIGLIEPDLKSVTIKAREFYFYVWGGMIKVICWACGTTNLIVDDKFELENKEVVSAEETKGHQRAMMKPWVNWGDWKPKKRLHGHNNNGRNFGPKLGETKNV